MKTKTVLKAKKKKAAVVFLAFLLI